MKSCFLFSAQLNLHKVGDCNLVSHYVLKVQYTSTDSVFARLERVRFSITVILKRPFDLLYFEVVMSVGRMNLRVSVTVPYGYLASLFCWVSGRDFCLASCPDNFWFNLVSFLLFFLMGLSIQFSISETFVLT